MPIALVVLLGIIYGVLTWKNFRLGALFFVLLLPTYLIRFKLGPLPSTFLEMLFGVLFLVWLMRYARDDSKKILTFFSKNRWFSLSLLLFFLSSIASIFISDMWWFSFGQWRAYILEPVLVFVIFFARQDAIKTTALLRALVLSTVSITFYGIYQKLSGFGLPDDGRIVSFYTSPNAIGLYVAPLLALAFGGLVVIKNEGWKKIILSPFFGILVCAAIAFIFSKSLGTILAFVAGLLLFLFLIGYKKTTIVVLVLVLLLAFLTPARNFILSKDRSSGNRLVLWEYSWEYLTKSPKNFVFGTGIRQFFRKIQKPEYKPEVMERLIYPHNIIFNFWTELGLFGVLGFLGIFCFLIKTSYLVYKENIIFGASLLALLAIFFLHGLIDVPYFKNDLAMMFWIVSAFIASRTKV